MIAKNATVAVIVLLNQVLLYPALWVTIALLASRCPYLVQQASIARPRRLVFPRNVRAELTAQKGLVLPRSVRAGTIVRMPPSLRTYVPRELCARQPLPEPASTRHVRAGTTVRAKQLLQYCAMPDSCAVKDRLPQAIVQQVTIVLKRGCAVQRLVNAGTIVLLDHQHRFLVRRESIVQRSHHLNRTALQEKAARTRKHASHRIVPVDISVTECQGYPKPAQLGRIALGVRTRLHHKVATKDRIARKNARAVRCLAIAHTIVQMKG